MTNIELFQAFVAPSIFISGGGLLILSLNARLMGMVTRLRAMHHQKHESNLAEKKQEAAIIQSQIDSIEKRASKIKNAFFFVLLGVFGVMISSLLLGLSLYLHEAYVVATILFVMSVGSMAIGLAYYIVEVSVSLSSVQEEIKLFEIIDLEVQDKNSNV